MLADLAERKPIVGCFSFPSREWAEDIVVIENASAFVSYPTPERAAAALANLWLAGKSKVAFE